MKKYIYSLLLKFNFDQFMDSLLSLKLQVQIARYEKKGLKINFVSQGGFNLTLAGDLVKLKIDKTSHLKSDTFMECSGGITIGKYFHPGRGLTIFSTNHDYDSNESIPYGSVDINRPVLIKDFVWCGANVTIIPGAIIGEGVVIAGGSLVSGSIPDYAVVGGNPARVIKYRNLDIYKSNKSSERFV